MKTRLIADFSKSGDTTDYIKKIICTNNEGAEIFRIPDIISILKYRKSELPHGLRNMKVIANEKEGVLEVYEDGETLTCSIQENEYYTIEMVDDLMGEDFEPTKKNLKRLYNKQIAGEDALLLNPIYDRNNI
ncbi:MAG: hypothetical protein ABI091_29835 [Ferruginibacter sp.]